MPIRAAVFCLSIVCASGAGVFTDACGTEDFAGPASTIVTCIVNGNPLITSRAGGRGVAGLNFFENRISPVRFDQQDINALGTIVPSYITETNPTWKVPVTPVELRLVGLISILEVNGSISLTLTGRMTGVDDLVLTTGLIDASNCDNVASNRCTVNLILTGMQLTGSPAFAILDIVASGRVRYEVEGSPVYLGGVPESSTYWMAGTALALLVTLRRRR